MFTLAELTERLLAFEATQFIGLVAVHVPQMKVRKNPFHGKVLKLSRVNGAINWSYGRAVNRQRKREDKPADFKPKERTWGNRINHCPLVIHLQDVPYFYLELKRERVERWYFDNETLQQIPETELMPYFPKRAKSRQKLDREVTLRDYRLDHIAELTIGGETWKVDPCWWKLKVLRQSLQLQMKAKT
jgi:hypothetical protein